MSKQRSFHVTSVAMTFWWVRDPFVKTLARPSGSWARSPFCPISFPANKGWSQRLLFGWILRICSWKWSKWTPSPWQIPLWVKLEGFTVRPAIMSGEGTWFLLVPEQFWPFICSMDFTVGSWFVQPVSRSNYQEIQMQVQMVKWYLIAFWNFNQMERVLYSACLFHIHFNFLVISLRIITWKGMLYNL